MPGSLAIIFATVRMTGEVIDQDGSSSIKVFVQRSMDSMNRAVGASVHSRWDLSWGRPMLVRLRGANLTVLGACSSHFFIRPRSEQRPLPLSRKTRNFQSRTLVSVLHSCSDCKNEYTMKGCILFPPCHKYLCISTGSFKILAFQNIACNRCSSETCKNVVCSCFGSTQRAGLYCDDGLN